MMFGLLREQKKQIEERKNTNRQKEQVYIWSFGEMSDLSTAQ
jgi:hypothetical protein